MSYILITIPPEGEITYKHTEKAPTIMETIRPMIGGIVQIVPYFSKLKLDGVQYNRGTAYCHEEGWLLRLPPNPRAHEFWKEACPKGDPNRMHIAGPLVFVAKEKPHVAKG